MRLHHSLKHALDGIFHAFKEHANMRIHLATGTIAFIVGLFFHLDHTELIILLFTITLVMAAEMINTAIESMTDLITTEHHQRAKIAKDVSAGMVLTTAALSVIVGLVIFLPHLIDLIA